MLKEAIIITGIPPTSLSGTGDLLLYLKNNIKFKIAWKPVSFLSAIKIFLKSTYNENCNTLEVFKSLVLYFTKVYPLVRNE